MNMKKFIALALTALVSVGAIFAQSLVVKSVKGTVTYEAEPKVMKNVTVGQELSLSTVVELKLGAELVVELNGTEYKIKGMKSSEVLEKLIASVTPKVGLKTGGSAAGKTAADTAAGSSVSTASSRASEVKDDMDWVD